jgi:hypothetical protein
LTEKVARNQRFKVASIAENLKKRSPIFSMPIMAASSLVQAGFCSHSKHNGQARQEAETN